MFTAFWNREKILKSLKIPKIVKSAIFHVLLRKNVTNNFSINRCEGQYLDSLSIHEEQIGGFRVTFWDNRGLLSKKHVFGRNGSFFRLAKKLNLQFFANLWILRYWCLWRIKRKKLRSDGAVFECKELEVFTFFIFYTFGGISALVLFQSTKKALNYTLSSR